jgi:hypothetical protein
MPQPAGSPGSRWTHAHDRRPAHRPGTRQRSKIPVLDDRPRWHPAAPGPPRAWAVPGRTGRDGRDQRDHASQAGTASQDAVPLPHSRPACSRTRRGPSIHNLAASRLTPARRRPGRRARKILPANFVTQNGVRRNRPEPGGNNRQQNHSLMPKMPFDSADEYRHNLKDHPVTPVSGNRVTSGQLRCDENGRPAPHSSRGSRNTQGARILAQDQSRRPRHPVHVHR